MKDRNIFWVTIIFYFYHRTIITIKENEKELKESWKAYNFIQREIT